MEVVAAVAAIVSGTAAAAELIRIYRKSREVTRQNEQQRQNQENQQQREEQQRSEQRQFDLAEDSLTETRIRVQGEYNRWHRVAGSPFERGDASIQQVVLAQQHGVDIPLLHRTSDRLGADVVEALVSLGRRQTASQEIHGDLCRFAARYQQERGGLANVAKRSECGSREWTCLHCGRTFGAFLLQIPDENMKLWLSVKIVGRGLHRWWIFLNISGSRIFTRPKEEEEICG
ncbi:hypothetical protein K440DRAFT_645231 [Wilcoxina mikolae CBS 423.85]|nr:hypothetical protein K440DRAFT_645231 [Wilcoxina mikolae CBS 423.85]